MFDELQLNGRDRLTFCDCSLSHTLEPHSAYTAVPGNDTIRFVFRFKRSGSHFLVVKLWLSRDEPATLKIWKGDLGKTISYWKTNVKCYPAPELWSRALIFAAKSLNSLLGDM